MWSIVACENPSAAPCERSLHACALRKDSLYVFGGYDGLNRVNDFLEYNFNRKVWSTVNASGIPPSPRDRHVAIVYQDSFYIFAGFDGTARVNDFFEFNFMTRQWSMVHVEDGIAPSPRHSHAAVVYDKSLYCFGGYDGSYRNDFHEYCFESRTWKQVAATGRIPRARYRASLVVHENTSILFGGHDGSKHLNDVHVFDFDTRTWSSMIPDGAVPVARDSHVAAVYGQSMYIFGGSTGAAMNDFYELRIDMKTWSPVHYSGVPPNQRFCHVGCMYNSSIIIFGGYDGSNRLNDFQEFRLKNETLVLEVPPSTLLTDFRDLVNQDILSDVTFIVEGTPVFAHKILCVRCGYFKAMLTSDMREAHSKEIIIKDIRRPIFLSLLEYLYTDEVEVPMEIAMELFVAADQFGVDRLKKICENRMLMSLNVENAASILYAAEAHNATTLREHCINFVLQHFDVVIKTTSFEEMGRNNVELLFEVLRRR